MGRWTLAALVVNSIIGSGIFGLPDDVARSVGAAAPLAYLLAAVGIGVIMACFAEVSSQFDAAGGPYLYARAAFGQLAGIQMGWCAWLVRLTSAAANANLFVDYLGQFWPATNAAAQRAAVLTVLLGLLAGVNVRGVRGGAQLSNVFTLAKLAPLLFFIVAGLALAGGNIRIEASGASAAGWLQAVLALMFAFGGFEAALMPMAEARHPRRDAPFALLTGLAVVAAVYMLVHLVVMGALSDPAASAQRPLADAAMRFLGPWGASLMAAGALISTYGYLSGQFVSAPRLTYAFAEQKDFPSWFAAVHPKFRTPYLSILVYTALVWGLAVYGSFIWNAILAAVARLFTYGLVCGALLVLRRRQPHAPAFRLPAGGLFAAVGIGFCGVLIAQMNQQHLKIVLAVAAVGLLNWALVRVRRS